MQWMLFNTQFISIKRFSQIKCVSVMNWKHLFHFGHSSMNKSLEYENINSEH